MDSRTKLSLTDPQRTSRVRLSASLCVAILTVALVGCGGNGLPLVPVSGQVTFSGGICPAPGVVCFMPVEVAEGMPRRPASGHFGIDGMFMATSFQPGDGLIPGRYQVSISCNSGLPDVSKPDPWDAVSFVPKDYRPPELIVEEDGDPIEINYDVPPKKRGAVAQR